MRRTNDLAALSLIGAALALLMTILMPRASWAAPADRVEWGLHRVTLERTAVVVHSTWSLDRAPEQAVPLAAPLPPSSELSGAEPIANADGSIEALDLQLASGGEVHLMTRVPWSTIRRAELLPVPVPSGRSVHRVVLDPALSFSPDPALGLMAQVGHYAPAEFDVVARHRFDARTDGNLRHVGAYYVRGHDLDAMGAMKGEVILQRQRQGRAALVAGGIFGLLVLGMFVAQRRLNRHVQSERAESYLEEEFRALEQYDDSTGGSASQTQPAAPITTT
ncbi:MAG: hypothetical protein AAGF11_08100 [Myxococcota bacterium]